MRIDIRPPSTAQLSNFKATPGVLIVNLTWNVPTTDPSYRAAQVWVNEVNDFESAKLFNTVSSNFIDYSTTDEKLRYFGIRAVNEFGRADGAVTGPVSAKASLVTTGNIGLFDLATANIINQLKVANITGLGALATLNRVNANTQVTNLGGLAFADQIAANQIGAGQLAAGVVYAGSIYADQVTGGTFTGLTFQTVAVAGSGGKIVLNGSGITGYNLSGQKSIEIGGGAGVVYVNSPSNIAPAVDGRSTGSGMSGVSGTSSSGNGVSGSSSSGYGVRASSSSGEAIYSAGAIVQQAYGESSDRGIRTNNCVPVSGNTYNCGTLARPWMGVTTSTAPVVTSDQRTKIDVADSNLGLEFINKLRPVSYRLKVGRNEITHGEELMGPWIGDPPEPEVIVTPVEGSRYHYGLLAQEVKQTMTECNVDDAAFWALSNPADPDSTQALRYEELISPMIKAMQEMSAQIVALRAELDAVKDK